MEPGTMFASSKAQDDIRFFLSEQCLNIFVDREMSKVEKLLFFKKNLEKKLSVLGKNDVLYLQYPFYMGRFAGKELLKVIKKYELRTVLIIHDLNSLRFTDEKDIRAEIEYINKFDVIVAHNPAMMDWLIKNKCTSEIINMELFDYYLDKAEVNSNFTSKKRVIFAGNLIKSNFIYGMEPKKYQLSLYGNGYKENKLMNQNNIIYNGSFTPNMLVKKMTGEFGLVWDGESVGEVSGVYGDYIRYNNPHKVSLYIACGLPIIIWENAALANFVKSNGIGICVSSLTELDDVLNVLSENEYNKMKKNIVNMSDKLRTGYYTKKMFQEAEKKVIKLSKSGEM